MTIEIGWAMPEQEGGCAVLGYKIFMDDGNDSDLTTEVTGLDPRSPNINSFVIDLSTAGVVGLIYKFKVRADNINGDYVDTNALSVALASLPSKPLQGPVSDPSLTNMFQVGVQFDLFSTEEMNGGSEILNYEIQYDDGERGDFTSVIQLGNELLIPA
jgi:hypothetical protein